MQNEQPVRVLITRPESESTFGLITMLNESGMEAVHLPLIAYRGSPNPELFGQLLKQLKDFDWIIFNSPQAVIETLAALNKLELTLPTEKIIAIGEGTAKPLKRLGYNVLTPIADWRSEGVLGLAVLQNIAGLKIALIKGEGGRQALAAMLKDRAAEITEIIAYERYCPSYAISHVAKLINVGVDIVIATSYESMQNLMRITTPMQQTKIFQTILVVTSDRLKLLASHLGFQRIWVAKQMSNAALMKTIAEIKELQ